MARAFLSILLISGWICFVSAQSAAFTQLPKSLQFFPRGADDSGSIVITGTLTTAGYDTLSVALSRNGQPLQRFAQKLTYSGPSATFSLTLKIKAELAEYGIVVKADTATLAVCDSLVCGDAYLIDGQSNAVASAADSFSSEWIRTYGNGPYIASDSNWAIGQALDHMQGHFVGGWGIELARMLVDSERVPVCIINGARGSTYIRDHYRHGGVNDYYHLHYGNLYGLLYMRTEQAGLLSAVKALFWHQGENDGGLMYAKYGDAWDSLTGQWRENYPSLRKFYIFQVQAATAGLREVIREFPLTRSDNVAVALPGTPGFDGLHYKLEGYKRFAALLYPLVRRDFYGAPALAVIQSPNIQRAFWGNEERTRVVLEFDQPMGWPADSAGRNIRSRFQLAGFNGSIDSGSSWKIISHNYLRLCLSASCSGDAVSYLPDGSYGAYETAPFLKNSRGVGAFSFSAIPIGFLNPDPNDTLQVQTISFLSTPLAVEQFAKSSIRAIVNYAGDRIDTTAKGCTFTSLDTLVASVSPWGTLEARNAGTAFIRAEKRGFADTLSIVISPSSALLDSISLSTGPTQLLAGDSLLLTARGFFHNVQGSFSAIINTTVDWTSDSATVATVKYGLVKAIIPGGPVEIMASLNGKSASVRVSVFPAPVVLKRVNFQVTDFPFKTGWYADWGQTYTKAMGYGWLPGASLSTRDDRPGSSVLLRSFVGGTGTWRLDVPAGEYIIKAAAGDRGYSYAGGDTLWHGTDILLVHYPANQDNAVGVDTVTVTDTGGLLIRVHGAFNYIVVMSNTGMDINLLADDDGLPPSLLTPEENPDAFFSCLYSGEPTARPNPFNPYTVISFNKAMRLGISLTISTIQGKMVRKWDNLAEGAKSICWNGQDEEGRQMPSGFYLARIRGKEGYLRTIKLILMK